MRTRVRAATLTDTAIRFAQGATLALALASGLACAIGAATPASADEIAGPGPGGSYEVVVPIGKSQVINLPLPYSDVMVADPKVADVLPLNTRSVYIVGKGMGATAVTIYGPNKRLLTALNVEVSADIETFKARLHDLLPEETDVTVKTANQSIVLAGTVSSPAALGQIVTLADTFSPGKVVNMLGVEGTQQVMLSVRFVEMERTTAKDLGISIDSTTGANPKIGVQTGDSLLGPIANSFGAIIGTYSWHHGRNLSVIFDALEQKGLIKTLAEPTLVANSGDTASFLAGGEFPIPIASTPGATTGGFATITVAFKQFGISLAFTPTLLKDGLINLVVNPEVSSIDPTNSVNTALVSIPGLKVRRAHTTVELRDGESFTIAGLLSSDYQNQVRQYPFLGDLPVLGTFFRNTDYRRDEKELVIVVTPHLAVPRRAASATPGDHFVPPSDFELFLFGATEGDRAHLRPEDRALLSGDPTKGGIDGPHGHVLY